MTEPKPPEQPLVAVVRGSESDLTVMRPCAEMLRELGVPCEMRIASAHRTPERVSQYATAAAAHTELPVIGVPMDATPLRGVDALHSMVQMPSGVPVATVSIDGARNAAVLAARILALEDEELAERLAQLAERNRAKVEESDKRLQLEEK